MTTIRPFHVLIAESGDPSGATTVYPFGALWDRDAATDADHTGDGKTHAASHVAAADGIRIAAADGAAAASAQHVSSAGTRVVQAFAATSAAAQVSAIDGTRTLVGSASISAAAHASTAEAVRIVTGDATGESAAHLSASTAVRVLLAGASTSAAAQASSADASIVVVAVVVRGPYASKPPTPLLNAAHPLADHLWACWAFSDRGVQLRDSGPQKLHANRDTQSWTADRFGRAYQFDVTGERFVIDRQVPPPRSALTIAALVTTRQVFTDGNYGAFPTSLNPMRRMDFVIGYNRPDQVRLILNLNGSREDFGHNISDPIDTGFPEMWTARRKPNDAAVDFYRNGVLSGVASNNNTGTLTTDDVEWGIGALAGNFNTHDQVCHGVWVWSRDLTDAEIQAHAADPFDMLRPRRLEFPVAVVDEPNIARLTRTRVIGGGTI